MTLGSFWVALIALAYLLLLFGIAYWADRRAGQGRSVIASPWVYSLSLAVYCSALAIYGTVGYAAKAGGLYLALSIGPTLAWALWWVLHRKIVRIARTYHITSIADFIAARHGKSALLAGIVSVIAVFGVVPYLALELKAVSISLGLLERYPVPMMPALTSSVPVLQDTGFWVTALLAVFVIVFGTRHLDTTERHEGMVAAIAFESVVKLVAFVAIGLFVTFMLFSGPADLLKRAGQPSLLSMATAETSRWNSLVLLSMVGAVLLPRQFQVAVVENVDEGHLRQASWLFPLYLLVISLFVLPIAMAGLALLPGGAVDPDMFGLALAMAAERPVLAVLVFIGGLSAATAMVIVEVIALSTMLSNSLVVPLLLKSRLRLAPNGDLTRVLLLIRRALIVALLMMGYLYYRFAAELYSLVAIGTITLAAVAQVAPAFIGALYWKQGSRSGALAGLVCGFALWGYTLLLPSLVQAGQLFAPQLIIEGPFGWAALRPTSLFGLGSHLDFLSHGLVCSLLVNAGLYVWVSLWSGQSIAEQAQALRFVDVFLETTSARAASVSRGNMDPARLRSLLTRFLGPAKADAVWADQLAARGLAEGDARPVDASFVAACEAELAGAIGSTSARIVLDSIAQSEPAELDAVIQVLDEASQAIEYSHELERKSRELEATAAALRENQQRFRDLAESASDWFWETDAELRFTYISENFVEATGWPTSQVLGKRRWDIVDPRELAENADKWRRHREECEAHMPFRRFEYRVRSPDGKDTFIRITGKPCHDETGRFIGYRGTGSDVTSLVNTQQELLRTEKLAGLGGLVAGVAHEINTPVGIGLTAASHLADTVKEFERVYASGEVKRSDLVRLMGTASEVSSSVLTNLRRAADLVRSFKQVAVDQSSDQRRRFNLAQYIDETLRSLHPRLKRTCYAVDVRCPPDIELETFPGAYSQIVTNFVMNSLIHGFEGREQGRIEIDVKVTDGALQLRYADDGVGMTAAQAAQVFQPFYTTRRGQGGSGLGLHVVYNLVTQTLGGRIECLSTPGQGTAFVLRIPL